MEPLFRPIPITIHTDARNILIRNLIQEIEHFEKLTQLKVTKLKIKDGN
jgi:hypothetical protein